MDAAEGADADGHTAGFTRRIVGVPKAESDAVLSLLFHQLSWVSFSLMSSLVGHPGRVTKCADAGLAGRTRTTRCGSTGRRTRSPSGTTGSVSLPSFPRPRPPPLLLPSPPLLHAHAPIPSLPVVRCAAPERGGTPCLSRALFLALRAAARAGSRPSSLLSPFEFLLISPRAPRGRVFPPPRGPGASASPQTFVRASASAFAFALAFALAAQPSLPPPPLSPAFPPRSPFPVPRALPPSVFPSLSGSHGRICAPTPHPRT